MSYLIDTSVLVRTINVGNPLQSAAIDSLSLLRTQGETLCVVPQNLIEFWAVATRPLSANGLGITLEEAENQIAEIKLHFILKPEDETIFENWESLVKIYHVSGKTTHDARIVAAMQTHRMKNLLTFNISDFQRYSPLIAIESPLDIISQNQT